MNSIDRWLAELKTLGISAKRKNALDDGRASHWETTSKIPCIRITRLLILKQS